MKTTVVDFSGIVPPSYDDWWGNKWMRDGWDQCSAQWKQRFDAFVAMHKPSAKVVKVWDCNDNVSPLFAEGWRMAMSFMKGELKNAGVPYTDSGYIFTPGERENPAAKPEAKPADVPVVDAVWVEFLGECVYAYTSIEAATKVWQRYLDKGEARIVRIRTVDEKARAELTVAQEQIKALGVWCKELESRLAALEKPADKDAARVVKAPGRINASEYAQTHWPISVIPYVENAIALTHLRWREALASQGITVADDNSTQH